MNQSKLSSFVRNYWDYYLDLEYDFLQTKKYVAFDIYNKDTYSVEYLKLLQAVCSEIDVVAKEISYVLDPAFKLDKTTGIQKWGYVLQNKMPRILTDEVVFDHSIRVSPWKNWLYEEYENKKGATRYRLKGSAKTPQWWNAYNCVKHQRTRRSADGHTNFTQANLYNLIHSFAALYILETEYMATLYGDQEPVDGIGSSALFQPYYKQFEDSIY